MIESIGPVGTRVAANIQRLRKARGLSQLALQELIGKSSTYLCKIEKMARRVDTDDLVTIARGLGVDPLLLLSALPECGVCLGAPAPGFTCNSCGVSA